MKVWGDILDENFPKGKGRYIWQSLIAIGVVTFILFSLDILAKSAIVAALGASSFIVFAMPKTIGAQPRNVIGGHIIGLITGSLCYFAFLTTDIPLGGGLLYIVAGGMAVGLSMFGMAITKTEHPPAGGTALGIIAHGWTFKVVIFVIGFAVMLSFIRYLLRNRLGNLGQYLNGNPK